MHVAPQLNQQGPGFALVQLLEAAVPEMAARAATLDATGFFPEADIALLASLGALAAPFPASLGGLGWGTEPEGAPCLFRALLALGLGNLSVGRLFEAHVNAVRLICRFGALTLRRRAAADTAGGALIGLWVTDPPAELGAPLSLQDGFLEGGKMFCSGAGLLRRAVVTASTAAGKRLVYASTELGRAAPLPAALVGMRAARTGQISFDGVPAEEDVVFGAPGDYLTEPDFSAGAWRTSAVTAGGLSALVRGAMRQVAARGHSDSPQQQDRLGRAHIDAETAYLWAERAAHSAEGLRPEMTRAAIVAEVGFARIAVEAASLDALIQVERSLGLAAFAVGNPLERIARDLRTYLRQPAPDAVLTEAAAYQISAVA